MPSFTKMREFFLLENPLQNSWLSEALTLMEGLNVTSGAQFAALSLVKPIV